MGRPRKKPKEPTVTRRPLRKILPRVAGHTGIPWACVRVTNSPPALPSSRPCMRQVQDAPQAPNQEANQEIRLPEDAVMELSSIPGIWDLAVEMGFLPPCSRQQDGPAMPLPSVAPVTSITGAHQPSTSTCESEEERWILRVRHHLQEPYYREVARRTALQNQMEDSPAADSPQGPNREASQEIGLPEDVIEELNSIPGIWDLATEMCFLLPPY